MINLHPWAYLSNTCLKGQVALKIPLTYDNGGELKIIPAIVPLEQIDPGDQEDPDAGRPLFKVPKVPCINRRHFACNFMLAQENDGQE